MKSTYVDSEGRVRCPVCGAANSFTSKRTGKAKLAGAVTVGVGALAAPKRLKCDGCGTNLKRGSVDAGRRLKNAREESADLRAERRALRDSGLSLWATQKAMSDARREGRGRR